MLKIYQARKPNCWKHLFHVSPIEEEKDILYLFQIHLVSSKKTNNLPLDKFFNKWRFFSNFTCTLLIDIQIAILIKKKKFKFDLQHSFESLQWNAKVVHDTYILFINKNNILFSFNKWWSFLNMGLGFFDWGRVCPSLLVRSQAFWTWAWASFIEEGFVQVLWWDFKLFEHGLGLLKHRLRHCPQALG